MVERGPGLGTTSSGRQVGRLNIFCLLLTAGWGVQVAGLAGWVGSTLVGAVLEVVSGGGKKMPGCGAPVALEL